VLKTKILEFEEDIAENAVFTDDSEESKSV